jgi:two-component system, NarL family, sensor kinase
MKIKKMYVLICLTLLIGCNKPNSKSDADYSIDTTSIIKLNKLSQEYWENDAKKSKRIANEALSKSIAINYKSGIVQAKNNLGVVYDIIGNYDSALIFYNEALILSQSEKFDSKTASILNNIGLIYWNESRNDEALIKYHEALKIFEKLNNVEGIANTANNLGLIYADVLNFEQSKHYAFIALDNYSKNSDTNGTSIVYNNLGNLYQDKTDFINAEIYYKKSYRLKEKTDIYGQSVVLINWAEIKKHLNNWDTAEIMINKAIPMKIKLDDKVGLITCYNVLSDLYFRKKQYQMANTISYKALAVNKDVKALKKQKGIYTRLYNSYIGLGEIDSIAKYRDLEHEISDSIYSEKMSDETAKYSVKYKTLEKEKENLQLSQKIKQKNYTLMIVIFTLALLSILFWLLYSRYKLKKEAELNTLIQKSALDIVASEQKERTRIATDLHDSVGQSLTLLKMYAANAQSLHENFNQVLNNTITEVRQISHNLVPEIVNLGIVFIMNDICLKINATKKIKCEFNYDKALESISFGKEIELSLYRILQEITSNMLKHAECTLINMEMCKIEDNWHIIIKDNGKGFDMKKIDDAKGLGLNSIFTRAKLIHAEIDVKSNTLGTRFDLKL